MCSVLRDERITYLQYVTELTYLLFLKMTKETGTEEQLAKAYRWDTLAKKDGVELLESIDALDWFNAKSEWLGDLYGGLPEKNAEETRAARGSISNLVGGSSVRSALCNEPNG